MRLKCNFAYIVLLLSACLTIGSLASAQTTEDNSQSSKTVSDSQIQHKVNKPADSSIKWKSGLLDLSQLNLTDGQKEKIHSMRSQNAPQARQIRQDIRTKRMELRDLMFDPKASEQDIKLAGKQLNQLQGKLEDIAVGDFLYIRSILAPEQMQLLPQIKPGVYKNKQSGNQAPGGLAKTTPVN